MQSDQEQGGGEWRDGSEDPMARRHGPRSGRITYVAAGSPYPRSAAFQYDPSHDARTRERVCEALRHQDELDASAIDVYVANGEVTLIGTVDCLREEQLAVEIAEQCEGVRGALSLLQLIGSEPGGPYPRVA